MKNKFVLTLVWLLTTTAALGQNLIPLPNRADRRDGSFLLTRHTEIVSPDFPGLADYLNDHLERLTGYRLPVTEHLRGVRQIVISQKSELPSEGYTLDVTIPQIRIEGRDYAGAFYALQTLFQLLPASVYDTAAPGRAETVEIPGYLIEDSPRFPYRGVMLDVSRTYFDKETVIAYIDWMARHKLNRLHWHLTDDNGWRIEIKKYPELTSKGAWRGPGEALPPSYGSGERRYGGYFTQDDVREIVRFAASRAVEIIPEIDLPGHSQTLTSVYPETFCLKTGEDYPPEEMRNVLCAGREENFAMLRDILTELASLFPSKYIHIGGDEVSTKYWSNCPRCKALMQTEGMRKVSEIQSYFVRRLETIVRETGKSCAAWNEVLEDNRPDKSTLIYAWKDTAACAEAVRAGQPVVMMPAQYCYIDMKQSRWERGHTWAWLVDTRRVYSFDPDDTGIGGCRPELVLGIEAAQWAELLDRPERFVEYQGYPRLCALAEAGWTEKGRRNWNDFYARLTSGHLDRLSAMGIRFRMFPPEADYRDGTITVRSTHPDGEVRYTNDSSEPTLASALYESPIRTKNPERYLFRTFYGEGHSPAVPATADTTVALGAGSERTVRIPLERYVDRNGLWLLSVSQQQDNAKIDRMEVNGPDTAYTIIRNGQKTNPFNDLRLYIDERNRTADLILALSNRSQRSDTLTLGLRPSPYIEPPVRVTSSLVPSKRFPLRNASDYHFGTYTRVASPCKAGDYILFTFEEPVDCESVDLRTGIPNVTRYIVTKGRVAWSSDGRSFIEAGPLNESGQIVWKPHKPVRAIRVSIEGSNGETAVCWQDLRITPTR